MLRFVAVLSILTIVVARILRPGDDNPQYSYDGVLRDALLPPESTNRMVVDHTLQLQALNLRMMTIRATLGRERPLQRAVGGLLARSALREESEAAVAASAVDVPRSTIFELSTDDMAEAATKLKNQVPMRDIF